MKPDHEMHVALEEPEMEPWDLFVELGMMIIEGRTPMSTGRGYGEGPHCQLTCTASAAKNHTCHPEDSQCIQQQNFRKHMLLLWKNNIPMSIEVLLCPECCHEKDKPSEVATGGPEPSFILLEQWTVHMIPRRGPENNLPSRAVVQAVRSYLHFSQLSAWYSRTAGKSPKNVIYRVCVPGEAFSNKFNQTPEEHAFPVANVGHNNVLKVSVNALPRSSVIPRVVCPHHHSLSNTAASSFNTATSSFSSSSTAELPPKDARKSPLLEACAGDISADHCNSKAHNKPQPSAKRGSDGQIMLGDSLIDPPQLLEMYPKRYQSPSRSGSPVMETPEHWMFGSRNRRGANRIGDSDERPVERGRSWAKKRGNESDGTVNKCGKYGSESEEETNNPNSPSTKHLLSQLKTSSFDLNPEDTVQLLRTIRHKQLLGASKYDKIYFEKLEKEDKDLSELLSKMELKQLESNQLKNRKWAGKRSCVWDKGQSGIPLSPLVKKCVSSSENTRQCHVVKSRSCMSELSSGTDVRNTYCSSRDSFSHKNNENWDQLETYIDENEVTVELCNENAIDVELRDSPDHLRKEVPSAVDKAKFRRSLDSAASLVFHSRSGLPLTSSPAPMRKGTRFDFDSSLTSVAAIKYALFEKDGTLNEEEPNRQLSTSAPPSVTTNTNLLGNFEESVLNGRLEPVSTVEGFTAEIGASGSFCPKHVLLPVTVFFYKLSDADKVSTPYLGHINLGKKGYLVPKSGTIQVTLFNPHGTVVKMFVIMYDLNDMPPHSQTFLRQRTLYMPTNASDEDPEARSWLRYLVHLRFASSKSGRIYLHTDIRIVVFRKSDMDMAPVKGEATYELRSFTRGPSQPRFSTRKKIGD